MIGDESAILSIALDEESADAAFGQLEERTEMTERQIKKTARQITAAWKEFFSFLESGSSIGSDKIKRLSESFDRLKTSIAGATADGLRPLLDGLEELASRQGQVEAAMPALGQAILAAASAPLATWARLVDLMREAAVLGGANANQRIGGGSEPGAAREWAPARGLSYSFQPTESTTRLGIHTAPRRIRAGGGGGDGARAPDDLDRALDALTLRAGPGGGALPPGDLENMLSERWQQQGDLFGEIQQDMTERLAEESEKRQSLYDSETKAWIEGERAKQAAVERTVAAMSQMLFATIAQGAAEGKSAKQIANKIAVASAWQAGYETAAAIGALAITWGVMNPAAAGHFASAGMFAALAGGSALLGAALPGGGRGGRGGGRVGELGGGFARGYGGSGGGGGAPVAVSVEAKIQGGVLFADASGQRALGDAMSAAIQNGFVRSRGRPY